MIHDVVTTAAELAMKRPPPLAEAVFSETVHECISTVAELTIK
eukprot:CAMPEP_0171758470 /NCGR_PEP_ID=MMETSP0991-20121206/46296_1 /TAXON_ID=483369 /ORGANISM="non described non described, Strain CCMP2098" /LENGTH=42 /DNA_ID= /DNA_START= /DNA_END= /DNA_ORIENTATION=